MLRRILLTAGCAWAAIVGARAQAPGPFYDLNTIQDIHLTFTQPNWDYQMDTAKAGSEGYIIAANCTINGVSIDSVGVKYKGNSSYHPANAKNPLHIELDHVRGSQAYQSFTDIKLSNVAADPSFVREVLSYDILRNYMDAPRANFARVYINGAYYGLMTNVESVNKRFLTDHFYSSGNVFFKCNPAQVGVLASDLRYRGPNPAFYYSSYELKSATGWDEMVNLCDTLSNSPAALAAVLDLDRATWMLAFNNVLVNLDSYSGAFRQNYYLYRNADRQFCSVVWDLNMSFGAFPMLNGGGGPGGGGMLDTTGLKNMLPGANGSSANHPLIQKIWNTPALKRRYIAHLRTLAEELAGPARQVQAQQLQALIRPDVAADTHKFYSLAQFNANLTTYVGNGGGSWGIPGVLRLLTGRLSYLFTTPELTAVAPTLAVPATTPAIPQLGDTVWVSTAVTGTAATSVLLSYRYDHSRKFNQVPMYDDGLHHDGAPADGVYGAGLVARALLTEYYLYAENATAGVFSPRRAEHEFYSFTATAPLPTAGQVVLNELLADNAAGQTNAAGNHEDWLELYNTTATPLDLTGLYLTDDPALHNKWAFPAGTIIGPNGFLIVWADNDPAVGGGLHANFKLSKNGEFLLLSNGSTAVLDSVAFGTQATDSTWGRLPNGTGPWRRLPPTFDGVNQLIVAGTSTELAGARVSLYPNPATDAVTISVSEPADVVLTDALGHEVRRLRAGKAGQALVVSTAELPVGVYWVRSGTGARHKLAVLR